MSTKLVSTKFGVPDTHSGGRLSTIGKLRKSSGRILKPPFSSPPSVKGLEIQILWAKHFVDISISPMCGFPGIAPRIVFRMALVASTSWRDALILWEYPCPQEFYRPKQMIMGINYNGSETWFYGLGPFWWKRLIFSGFVILGGFGGLTSSDCLLCRHAPSNISECYQIQIFTWLETPWGYCRWISAWITERVPEKCFGRHL